MTLQKFLTVVCLFFFASVASPQWAPKKTQDHIRHLMPAGVPFEEGVKAYKLTQKFQSIYVLNGHEQRDILPVTRQDPRTSPWEVSGGMHWSDPKDWRNVTALHIPDGKKIRLWEEYTDAGAPFPVRKWRWRFPEGTLAYDILIRRGQPERIFEVRVHEKLKAGWDHGTTYRPAINEAKKVKQHNWRFDSAVTIQGQAKWSLVSTIADRQAPMIFEPRRRVITDGGDLVPFNYVGAGTACVNCHKHAGLKTGYGQALRGDDGRFSWHPFTPAGAIDRRWPVKIEATR